MERKKYMLFNGVQVESVTVAYKGIPKKDVNIEAIPHFTKIDGLEVLVTISGRKLLCLACNVIRHKANECSTPFFGRCQSLKKIGHTCVDIGVDIHTYANKVKNKLLFDSVNEMLSDKSVVIVKNKDVSEKQGGIEAMENLTSYKDQKCFVNGKGGGEGEGESIDENAKSLGSNIQIQKSQMSDVFAIGSTQSKDNDQNHIIIDNSSSLGEQLDFESGSEFDEEEDSDENPTMKSVQNYLLELQELA